MAAISASTRASDPTLAVSPIPEFQFQGGEVRILVIDDDPEVGKIVRKILDNQELRVDVVSDPNKIEATVRGNTEYHVILLDYVIPKIEATTILEWIKVSQSDACVIVVTAYPSMDSALTCLRSHTYDYIPTPLQLDQVKKSVMRCLESRGLLRISEEALREQIGTAIRERRKGLGLTLADLAKRTGVSLGYLSQIELGKNSASIETLYRIALGLRIKVAELFEAVQSPI